jgi:hypothetical protein
MDSIARIVKNSSDSKIILDQIGQLFYENSRTLSILPIIFGIFYAASSVLSRAMFHIFYVQYYLDVREEHEMKTSFLKPLLRKMEREGKV